MRAARVLALVLGVPALAGAGERDVRVTAEAGVFTYAGGAADLTEPGATYGFSLGMETIPPLAVEVGFLGAVARTAPRGSSRQASVLENGGHLLAQLGPEVGIVRPFALGGVALSRLTVLEPEAAAGQVVGATLLRVPLGLGLDVRFPSSEVGDLTLGVRGTYHHALAGDAFPRHEDPGDASQVSGVLRVGGTW